MRTRTGDGMPGNSLSEYGSSLGWSVGWRADRRRTGHPLGWLLGERRLLSLRFALRNDARPRKPSLGPGLGHCLQRSRGHFGAAGGSFCTLWGPDAMLPRATGATIVVVRRFRRRRLRVDHRINDEQVQPQILPPTAIRIEPHDSAQDAIGSRCDDLNGKLVREIEFLIGALSRLDQHDCRTTRRKTETGNSQPKPTRRARSGDHESRNDVAQSRHRCEWPSRSARWPSEKTWTS